MLVALALAVATTLVVLSILDSPAIPFSTPQQALRRRLSRVAVPTDPAFRWDGSTSDLAQQFYLRHVAGATAEPLSYSDEALPAAVRARLRPRKLSFRELPPLLQRALVWDSGFAFSPAPQSKFTRIYTVGGVSMARIGVTMAEYLSAGCNTSDCTDPNGAATFRSKTCSGSMMLSVAHCASEDVTEGLPHMSMWATGGDPAAIPTMNIERHSWDDKVYLEKYLVFAVHTTADENEPPWDNCPSPGVYGSAIIPCDLYTPSRAAQMNWTDPAPSALVDAWLDQVRADAHRSPLVVGLPVGGGLALAAVLGYGWLRCRRRSARGAFGNGDAKSGGGLVGASSAALDQGLLTPRSKDPYMVATDSLAAYRGAARHFSTHHLLTTLLNDPHLRARRLNYAKLVFERDLAQGAFGEVWQCSYDGAVVAPFHILKLVMAGTLKPNFTDACPAQVRVVADLCLRRDPAQRPSATEVVALLEALADARESF
ncbi:hypothetical protein PybrP1_002712 [[Pythium] brassicae (nom. inval.)]|nr:hypothetical protein PybrP1_002712 [[Pythium] brassicae (nom. inval.)]